MPLDTSKKVLVTGATGFIGKALISRLKRESVQVYAAVRRMTILQCPVFEVGEINADTDWGSALRGIDAVVHLAAYAHVTSKTKVDHALLRKTNVEGAANLARQAAQASVGHFVFLSSIGAMADSSDHALTIGSPCRPTTPYGASKLDAENAIKDEAKVRGMDWTILRAPLVYGPSNPGNMRRLLKLVQSGIPLPFASVRNRRSFIYVENLTDMIANCLCNPRAFGKIFLPSDGEDVSTPQLIRAIARANESVQCPVSSDSVRNKPTRNPSLATRHSPRLFPFPETPLKVMGRLPGLGALGKLTSSLYFDSEPMRRDLGWTPPFSMAEGLKRTLGSSTGN